MYKIIRIFFRGGSAGDALSVPSRDNQVGLTLAEAHRTGKDPETIVSHGQNQPGPSIHQANGPGLMPESY